MYGLLRRVQTFAQVPYGTQPWSQLNEQGNFQSFGRAMMTLVGSVASACVSRARSFRT